MATIPEAVQTEIIVSQNFTNKDITNGPYHTSSNITSLMEDVQDKSSHPKVLHLPEAISSSSNSRAVSGTTDSGIASSCAGNSEKTISPPEESNPTNETQQTDPVVLVNMKCRKSEKEESSSANSVTDNLVNGKSPNPSLSNKQLLKHDRDIVPTNLRRTTQEGSNHTRNKHQTGPSILHVVNGKCQNPVNYRRYRGTCDTDHTPSRADKRKQKRPSTKLPRGHSDNEGQQTKNLNRKRVNEETGQQPGNGVGKGQWRNLPAEFLGMDLEEYLGGAVNYEYVLLPKNSEKATRTAQLVFTNTRLDLSAVWKLKNGVKMTKLKASGNSIDITETIKRCTTELNVKKEEHLQKHGRKIMDLESRLQALRVRKHIPLHQFEFVKAERKALGDKLQELGRQKEEFCSFVDKSILSEIGSLNGSDNWDHKIRQLRRKFEIEITRLDRALPIYARRQEILDVVSNNQVSIVLGETGSGKSTQMTQYLLEAGFADGGMIACTQPRKIAATSLAIRVSSELLSNVGQTVGYKVGMRINTSRETKIVYLTDHMLLNEILNDRMLSKYSCVVIDEAHERSIYTDLLLGMTKQCLKTRPELKVLITSATIDPELFVQYFNSCPVVSVSGQAFPVDVGWLDPTSSVAFENYVQSAVAVAANIHETENEGDILVFLTSPLETEKCCYMLQERLSHRNDYKCLQLHGKLQSAEQQAVFEPLSHGKRKIVFATNSAETSVTIPGISFVVDTGLVKEMRFDAKKNISSLNTVIISQSSAEQRKGRAGRTSSGKCFRLYTEEDFAKMETGSSPEILRIHLAQGLLKLLELGVDPLAFDFVQSPSEASMTSAMKSLKSIGAVEGKRITALGKRLSLLPFDPRLSKLVLTGIENDIAYEAICLAALTSAGSTIFFRAGSDEKKIMSDLLKTRFCHPDGDHLTLLTVYEEWFNVTERKKNAWCQNNSINARAIRIVRETASEVVTTIKKEMKPEIKVHFKPVIEIHLKIKDIIFQSSKDNVAFYLGHPRAGYLVPRQNQQAQIHPSSSLNVLGGALPEWVIFEQHINTSRDFLTTVSPVCRDMVLGAFEKGEISFNMTEVEKLKVSPICNKNLGGALFRAFVGPRFSHLRSIEVELSAEMQGMLAFIDADADELKIHVHTNGGDRITANAVLERHLSPTVKRLRSGDKEVPLHEETGSIRAVIGSGALCSGILLSGQHRTIFVESVSKSTDPEEIEELFSVHGEVIGCSPLKGTSPSHPDRWGSLTFREASGAAEAVAARKESLYAKAISSLSSGGSVKHRDFTLRLTWVRRQSRGFGFIHFFRPEDLASFLSHRHILRIDRFPIEVSLDKKTEDSVYMRRLPRSFTEEKVTTAVNECFEDDNDVPVVKRVAIIREAEFETSDIDLQHLQREIQDEILLRIPGIKVEVQMREPNPKNVLFTAFVHFSNPDEGVAVYNSIRDGLYVMGENVKVLQNLSVEIFIPKYLHGVLQEELEIIGQKLKTDHLDSVFNIVWKKSKAGHFYLVIKSESAETLTRVKRVYDRLLAGEVLDCANGGANLRILFSGEGKERLLDIEKRTETVIRSDFHMWRIAVVGTPNNRQNAIAQIQDYMDILNRSSVKRVELKGNENPRGLMKHLLNTHGTDFKGLKQKTEVEAIELDFRRQILTIRGLETSVQKAVHLIQEFSDQLSTDLPSTSAEDRSIECVVCLCPIERGQLYRLNLCGHAYCLDCAKRQLQVGINSRDLPLLCATEECQQLWCWSDVEEISRYGTTTIGQIVSASVSCFAQKHKDQYQYCLTPDCPIVFPLSKDGKLFICEACEMRICTTCKVQYHDGLTCAMFNSEKTDEGVTIWLRKDKTNRKLCPKCETPIEKNRGCHHMFCIACKTHICWLCLKTFENDRNCYGHLQRNHGTIGDEYDELM